ncbi:hypothetical protein CEXT_735881 [Caerostris extrusa]|uniref:Uncharacterized protein n=1 Tax=Caerostris extrusa TaxID=172846 RepID=A0AAV4Y1A3_CAEEX|nr:hypothetical protein CEXT_735881 [Caerostris extrusa]
MLRLSVSSFCPDSEKAPTSRSPARQLTYLLALLLKQHYSSPKCGDGSSTLDSFSNQVTHLTSRVEDLVKWRKFFLGSTNGFRLEGFFFGNGRWAQVSQKIFLILRRIQLDSNSYFIGF